MTFRLLSSLRLAASQSGAQAAASLTALLVALVIVLAVLGLVILAISLRRRQYFRGGSATPRPNRPDPWREAGRRVLPPDTSGDDTVDLDPWDLSPDDVGPSERNGGGTR